jgi:type IV secretory pathway TrbD component
MQRKWNRVAIPAAVVVAVVIGVIVGLANWYAGMIGFVIAAALFLWVARMSDKRFAAIIYRDLWRMATLIAGKS